VLFDCELYDDTTLQFRMFVAWRTDTPNTILLEIPGTRVSHMEYMYAKLLPHLQTKRAGVSNPSSDSNHSRGKSITNPYRSTETLQLIHPPSPINQILSTALTLRVFFLNPFCDHVSVNPSTPNPSHITYLRRLSPRPSQHCLGSHLSGRLCSLE
jgi:hypothetical protein